ncbi:MAG TPA: hypothetical protein VLZ07_08435 [Syntrophales bacterium]|nr:hypothetical protein [Syntrophales bacterium]
MKVSLTVEAGLVPTFLSLLQEGFRIQGNVGSSVRSFLCEQLGISPEYVEKRIQTIFLNGSAVDDVEKAVVSDGATLSLSAALPGLAGAVLRKGGYYAAMREEISCKGEASSASVKSGKVLMKLFNMPLQELGPVFLERGVWVRGERLGDILRAHADAFQAGCRSALIDGREITFKDLLNRDWQTEDVLLKVKTN